jgi:nitroreductase
MLECPDDLLLDRNTLVEALERVVRTRRSVRGFRADPVPPSTLQRVFATAQRSPSNCNVQPWRSYVASGEACARIRAALLARVDARVPPTYDFSTTANVFTGEYRKLQVECAVALYSEMGVDRGDAEGRWRAARRNFELFDAPHVVFVGMDKSFGVQVAIDVGIYLQTLMLAMTAHGIAC